MIDSIYCETLASYNQWMNQNLYSICADIPDSIRHEDRGAFFKSIHGTLNHLLIGDRIWMGRFTQQPFVAKLDQELYSDFTELWQARQQTDQAILDWAKSLSSEWLNQPFTYTSVTNNATTTRPAWLLVTHFFNHQTPPSRTDHHTAKPARLQSGGYGFALDAQLKCCNSTILKRLRGCLKSPTVCSKACKIPLNLPF